jgi:uncharacterized membrane protein YhaH (DUF805 family)
VNFSEIIYSLKYNILRLPVVSGRESGALFWPYAIAVFLFAAAGTFAAMVPSMVSTFSKMQAFAIAHPEKARIESGPGHYSIQIEGNHPELMPDMELMMRSMAPVILIAFILLAASVVRRLHDRDKSGLWGLLPVPFIAFSSWMMPKMFTDIENLSVFFAVFVSNALYLAGLGYLVFLLTGKSTKGPNRFGPANE